jgi:hypothetical protein
MIRNIRQPLPPVDDDATPAMAMHAA